MQLATSIVSTILDTGTRPGTRLPSSRKLAAELGISRLTTSLVYNELVLQGYLESLPRSGYVVSSNAPHRRMQATDDASAPGNVTWSDWLPRDLSKRRQIIKPRDWRNYPYPFIYGQADPALFNHSAWRDCVRRALGTRDFVQLADDRLTMDDELLVDYICRNTLPRRGIRAKPEQILITLGAQNALWLATQLLARRDRQAVLEDPGYPDFAETLRIVNMPTTYIPVDSQGLNPALLPQETGLVFVTPSHHIPTGVTMPVSRRVELLRRAEMQDFLIIEDDYEFEMSFLEPPSPSLKSLDKSGRVIYVGSFSKSIFPGLRVGYLVASEPFIEQARALRAMMLRHAPTHMQRVTAYFLALGHYDAHIVGLRGVFKKRRSALVEALEDCDLSIAGAARYGGSSLWISAPDHIDSMELSKKLATCGVLIEPGQPFFNEPQANRHYFRMGYSSINADRIPEGVALIRSHIR
ncbi:MocR-like pyridoxine biosynthesis transcription factor PdxR [Pseudorhizobium flavum]|uniref:MocR-like pyridoxine biosynthesis transcription factor PdxR n=1 Tax=Pseudorhizobium flavum TaxID=1335061 RepID=UPI00376F562B